MKNIAFTICKIVLLSCFSVTFQSAGCVLADGMYVSDRDEHLYGPNQKAVILWDGKKEVMILSAAVKASDIANFAWVVPVQSASKPVVSESNIKLFEELVEYFKKDYFAGMREGVVGPGLMPVRILEFKEIDVYDITILKAAGAGELINWLNNNGYITPGNAKLVLEKYIAGGDCFFVANKIDLKNKYKNELNTINQIKSASAARGFLLGQLRTTQIVKIVADLLYNPPGEDLIYPWLPAVYGVYDYFYEKPDGYATMLEYMRNVFVPYNLSKEIYFYTPDELRMPSEEDIPWGWYWFLTKDYMNKFIKENAGFLGGGQIGNIDWANIAYSFEECRNELLYKEWGHRKCLYTDIEGADWAPGEVVYSNPEIIKCPNVLGEPGEWPQDRRKVLSEKIPGFYNAYKKTKKEVVENWNSFEKFLKEELSKCEFEVTKLIELKETVDNLDKGIGTPLKFEFEPANPYYPLEISSANIGDTKIEVYVISNRPVSDSNKILVFDESKKIDEKLSAKLGGYIELGEAQYVTRLIYEGDLKHLKSDAKFEEKK